MGFLKKIKKTTGLGLSATEHYDRAFEKGVLLGPDHFGNAVSMFQKTATKAEQAGDSALAQRARANAHLYGFVHKGDLDELSHLGKELEGLEEIEQVGSRQESIPTTPLRGEIEARLLEARADQLSSADYDQLSRAHQETATAFKKIFNENLFTYKYHGTGPHTEKASGRFFYHTGMVGWNDALKQAAIHPDSAAEHMGKALKAFRECNDEDWSTRSETWLQKCRLRRTCWACHREFQGEDIHFRRYTALVSPYLQQVVKELGQDVSMLDEETSEVVLCTGCSSPVRLPSGG